MNGEEIFLRLVFAAALATLIFLVIVGGLSLGGFE